MTIDERYAAMEKRDAEQAQSDAMAWVDTLPRKWVQVTGFEILVYAFMAGRNT